MADTLAITEIGPEHHGTNMSLDEFARVEGRPGHRYELQQGVIQVVDVPGLPHGLVVQAIRNQLCSYQIDRPEKVYYIAAGSDAALRMPQLQSERHPDITVYLTRPPVADDHPWEHWAPDLVVEVVSSSSEERDYVVKRDEYLKAGVRLYWIVDPQQRTALVLTRRGDTWREERLTKASVLATALLPGLEIKLAEVFAVLD
jgi:Uma2 family endonuclease